MAETRRKGRQQGYRGALRSDTVHGGCHRARLERNYEPWVEISRELLISNYRAICATVGPAVEVAAVLKGNAYGHGMALVSSLLAEEGVAWFAVSSVAEAVALREGGARGKILLLFCIAGSDFDVIEEYGLTPVIHSLADLRDFDRICTTRGYACAFHLKVDTGLARLGMEAAPGELSRAVRALRTARFEGLMTHISPVRGCGVGGCDGALGRFSTTTRELKECGCLPDYIHVASTGALAHGVIGGEFNMVRVGRGLYGFVNPPDEGEDPVRLEVSPVLEWKTRLILVKELGAGVGVGYGSSFVTKRLTRTGVIRLGYQDGMPYEASNRGRVLCRERLAPIIGDVSMGFTTIDLTDVPEARVGDEVVIIGRQGAVSISAYELADRAGVLYTQLLAGISSSLTRVVV
jgi:alanine racemase